MNYLFWKTLMFLPYLFACMWGGFWAAIAGGISLILLSLMCIALVNVSSPKFVAKTPLMHGGRIVFGTAYDAAIIAMTLSNGLLFIPIIHAVALAGAVICMIHYQRVWNRQRIL